MSRLGSIIILGLITLAAPAQMNGIRLIFPESNGVYSKSKLTGTFLGFGYQKSIENRLNLGLDVVWGVDRIGTPRKVYNSRNGYIASWTWRPKSFTFRYHVTYSLNEDATVTPFIGSFIAVRRVNDLYRFSGSREDYSQTQIAPDPFDDLQSADVLRVGQWVIPVGLRAGIASNREDSWWPELHVDFGWQILGGKDLLGHLEIAPYQITTAQFFFGIGLSNNFMW